METIDLTDDEFLRAFEETTLLRALWTHEAHLRMAFLYLRREPDLAITLPLVRRSIRAYNCAQRNPDGYHETITVAFLRLVADALRNIPADADFPLFQELAAGLFRGDALLTYYTRERLRLPEARDRFIEPDRLALP